MKPYYKQGGFFDRLERFSDWIDDQICRPQILRIISENIDNHWFLLKKLEGMRPKTILGKKLRVAEMWSKEYAIDRLVNLYNQEKYWWMRAK